MLPSDLLIQRFSGEEIIPKRLPLSRDTVAMATELINLFRQAKDTTRGELAVQLQVLEGEETDYRIKRGLAHLLSSALSTFEMMSPLDPAILR
ncbi:MAG: DUF790 family protein, partial [Candidatus Tectomicrobia bacterium]